MIPMLLFLLVCGVALFLLRNVMNATVVRIIIVLIVLFVVLWLFSALGLIHLPGPFHIRGVQT